MRGRKKRTRAREEPELAELGLHMEEPLDPVSDRSMLPSLPLESFEGAKGTDKNVPNIPDAMERRRGEKGELAEVPLSSAGRATQTSLPWMAPPVAPSALASSRSADRQRKFVNAWKPSGKNLPDTANEDAMSFDLASNILRTGAYFKKKAGRRSSVTRYFFVGEPNSTQGFLKYFRDHKMAQTPRGGFDLVDLVRRTGHSQNSKGLKAFRKWMGLDGYGIEW